MSRLDVNEPTQQKIVIGNCDSINTPNLQSCEVRRGQSQQVYILFQILRASHSLQTDVHININGGVYPWDIGQTANVCRSLVQGRCPAQSGNGLVHRIRLPIPPGVRSRTPATVQIRTYNEHRAVQVCVQIRLIMI